MKFLEHYFRKARAALLSAAVAFAIFVGLAIISFIYLNNYAEHFSQSEYENISSGITSAFSERMDSLEADFKNISMRLYGDEDIQNDTVLRDFKFYKSFTNNGNGWRVTTHWTDNKARSSEFNAKYLKYFLNSFQSRNVRNQQLQYFIVALESIDGPVFLIAGYYKGDREILVLAEPSFVNMYSEEWFLERPFISSLSLSLGKSSEEMWKWDRGDDPEQVYNKVFTFKQAGQEWRLKIGVKKSSYFQFLKRLAPLSVIVFILLGVLFAGCIWRIRVRSQEVLQRTRELDNKDKEVEHILGEQKFLQEILAKSEEENRAIIDAVSDIIFETDTKGEIIFLNASWRKVTGFDPDQFIGQDLFSMLHPQEQKYQREDFSLLVKGQKSAYRSFTRLRTSDGNFRSVEIAVSMMRQDKDRNMRVVGTFTDVEERRRAERALGEAEKKYRAIVENAAGGIYQVTPEGIYLSANPSMARILGYGSPEQILREVKNANVSVYANPKERIRFLKTTEGNNEYQNYETQVYRHDKSLIWVNENVRAVRDEGGNVLYYEGSIEDITKRKESEIALREAKIHSDMANRAKSEFLANMSHELRTPLNSIIGFSEMISSEVMGQIEQPAYKEYANDIHRSGKSLLTIINEILDISKIEAGNRHLNEEVVDLEKVVFSCLDLLSTKIKDNKMQVMNTLQHTPKIVGEVVALKQVMMNILSNAIKFTPSDGRITISSDLDHHGELRLSITDTGIGLDPEELKKALSPFGQADSELNREGSGTGLGLTLVNSLMNLHQGRLDVLSQKGIGTTVTLVFPVERVVLHNDDKPEQSEGLDAENKTSSYSVGADGNDGSSSGAYKTE